MDRSWEYRPGMYRITVLFLVNFHAKGSGLPFPSQAPSLLHGEYTMRPGKLTLFRRV